MVGVPKDSRAFLRLFREHAPFVWRALRRHGVREADLEDACQEVFMVLHRRADDFHGAASLRTWLYGISLRVAANQRRRAHLHRERPLAESPEQTTDAGQLRALERRDARAALQRALASLTEERREVFVLYELEDLPMREVAKAVGCPLNTAYSRLAAARQGIRAHVGRERATERSLATATASPPSLSEESLP